MTVDSKLEPPSFEVQISAPVTRGQEYGTLSVRLGDEVITSAPLVALQDIAEGSLWQQVSDSVRLWLE